MPSSPRVSVAFQKARESARGAFSRPISKPIEEASFSPGIPYNFDSPPTPPSISDSATLCGVYTRNADSDPTYSLSSPGSSSYQLNKSSAPSAVPIGTPLDANDAGSDPTMVQPPNTDKTDETKGKKPSDPQDVYLVAASLPKIGRPANAWILYRSDKLRAIAAGESMPPLEDFLNRSKEVAEEATTSDEGVVVSTVKGKKKKKKSKPGAQDAPADQLEKIRATMNHQQAAENRPLLPPQAEISKLISFMWKNESRAVRKKYDRMSGIKRMEHEALHPGYKYQPMKKEEKVKLKAQKQKEKVILRIEKIHKAKEAKKQEKSESSVRFVFFLSFFGESTRPFNSFAYFFKLHQKQEVRGDVEDLTKRGIKLNKRASLSNTHLWYIQRSHIIRCLCSRLTSSCLKMQVSETMPRSSGRLRQIFVSSPHSVLSRFFDDLKHAITLTLSFIRFPTQPTTTFKNSLSIPTLNNLELPPSRSRKSPTSQTTFPSSLPSKVSQGPLTKPIHQDSRKSMSPKTGHSTTPSLLSWSRTCTSIPRRCLKTPRKVVCNAVQDCPTKL